MLFQIDASDELRRKLPLSAPERGLGGEVIFERRG
jgi:hypothetical protein